MSAGRRRFSGTANIVRFNRGKFIGAAIAVVALVALAVVAEGLRVPLLVGVGVIVVGVLLSLGVSYWVYDASDLYDLSWSNSIQDGDRIAVVHAGFDEVSATLQARHRSPVHVVSFFNRIETAEASIRRARGRGSGTVAASAQPDQGLLTSGQFDWVVAFMCLHELRTDVARQEVLRELRDGLAEDGKLVVIEHLRDLPNAVGFSIGVFHFMSRSSWQSDFTAAGLGIVSEKKRTPFVSEFVLTKAP